MVTREAFAREAEALAPSMARVAISILRAEHDAKDAVQQALVNGWAKRETIDEDRMAAYLMRIVVNECRNIQRVRRRTFPVSELPEKAYEQPDNDLRRALDELPEKLRTPLLLKYMEGMTEREVATALGMSVPQVKSRLFRARRALRALLTEEVSEP